jgi:hypothetical protein
MATTTINLGLSLDGLSNVDSTGKATGDVLEWNSVSGNWEAVTPSGGGGSSGGVHIPLKPITGLDYSISINGLASFTSGNSNTNWISLSPFIPMNDLITQSISADVRAANSPGLFKIVIYTDVDSYPSSLAYQSTDISCATAGLKTVNVNFNFLKGTTYWVGVFTNTAISFAVHSATQLIPISNSTPFQAFITRIHLGFSYSAGAPNPYPSTNSNLSVVSPVALLFKST